MRFFSPISLGLTCVTAAVAIVVGVASAGPPPVPGSDGDDPKAAEVAGLLYAQQSAWNARARSRAMKAIVAALKDESLHRALLRIVAIEQHPVRLEAIQAAGAIASKLARPLLEKVWRTAPVAHRVAAFDALDRLQPWDEGQILEQLETGKAANIRAALTVALRRNVLGGEQIAELLDHAAPEVVALAVRAYPSESDQHGVLVLLECLGDPETRDEAEEILRRIRLSDPAETLVTSWIDYAPHLRTHILRLITRMGRPLKSADRVIALAIGGTAADAEQEIAALSCLELTGTHCALEPIRMSLQFKDPVYKYYAARLMLSRGYELGYQVLLEILGEDSWESDEIHPNLAALLEIECWRLLAEKLKMPEQELRQRREELLRTGVTQTASGLGPSNIDLNELGEIGTSTPR